MPDAKPTVLVIDDDPDLRASVGCLLRSVGLEAQLFASISDFLKSDPSDGPTCLVLDIRLPGQSGLDLQRELAATNRELPIIFITGHGDIPMSVQAMKGGAIEFRRSPSVIKTSSTPFSSASLVIVLGARVKRLWPVSGSASNR
jgi:FixJ family two-component response regulator